ncbi:hypothetical protein M501DRAFT_1057731 [Patellaria atrata CBS 101060]|uniref:Extracellular membrane protein CFEM domain-containing protein n=1 Tax=Patellaria atrata CBS 101060 TaxID=1346257 RepID=A0A9P4SD73_9PEZI|nr:hypothetical protein M501DRAFT_1057731 [Patellaria atrata CBS 101060]
MGDIVITIAPETAISTALTSIPYCTWVSHCLGDPCTHFNDCDHDWICVYSVCILPTPVPEAPIPTWSTSSITTFETSTSETPFNTLTLGAPSTIIITSIPTSRSSNTSPESTSSNSITIGVGVGVPCTLAIIAIITYFLWRARRKRKHAQNTPALATSLQNSQSSPTHLPFTPIHGFDSQDKPLQRAELQGDEIYAEMDSTTEMAKPPISAPRFVELEADFPTRIDTEGREGQTMSSGISSIQFLLDRNPSSASFSRSPISPPTPSPRNYSRPSTRGRDVYS